MKFATLLSYIAAAIIGLLACGDGGGTGSPGFIGTTSSTPQPAQDTFVYTANTGDLTVGAALMSGSTGAFSPIPGAPFSDPGQPSAVAATPDGQLLFVSNFQTNTISGFNVGADGSMTPLTPAANSVCSSNASTGTQPVDIAVHPNGTLIYTANQGSNDITGIDFDSLIRCLLPTRGSPFSAGSPVRSVAIDRTGSILFAVTGLGLTAYAIDSSTGILTQLSTNNFNSSTLLNVTTSPVADLVYVAGTGNGNLIFAASVNTTTGALVPVPGSPFPVGGEPTAMAINPTGQSLYIANSTTDQITGFSVGANGALSPLAATPFPDPIGPVDISVDASGKFVVTANSGSGTVASFAIDATGALTPAGTFAIGSAPSSIALVKKPLSQLQISGSVR